MDCHYLTINNVDDGLLLTGTAKDIQGQLLDRIRRAVGKQCAILERHELAQPIELAPSK